MTVICGQGPRQSIYQLYPCSYLRYSFTHIFRFDSYIFAPYITLYIIAMQIVEIHSEERQDFASGIKTSGMSCWI